MIKSIQISFNYFFILLVTLSCSPNTSVAKRRAPQWVKERPVSSEYYIGIAVTNKNTNAGNYMQLAKNQALQDLASEISINISSNSVLHQFEDNTSFKEEFEANVKTSIVQELEAYEMLASWTNKKTNEYWVYYRLSKNQYALLKK